MKEVVIGIVFLVGGWITWLKVQDWFWPSRWGHIQWLENIVIFGPLVLLCLLVRVVFRSWLGLVFLSPLEWCVFAGILVCALDQFHPLLGKPVWLRGTLLFTFVVPILLGKAAGSLSHWFVGLVIGIVAILPVGAFVLWISEQRYIREIAKKQT